MPKEYTFALTEKEHGSAQRLHIRPRTIFKYLFFIITLLWLVACISSFNRNGFYDTIFLILLGVGIYFFVAYFIGLPLRSRRNFRKHKMLQQEQTFTFHDEGVDAKSSNGTGTINWSDFFKWKDGKDMILLYPAPNLFYPIPKRIFETESDLLAIHDLLSNCLGKPKA
jgi:hypothetical protein